ncbi:nucleoside hydrolase [Pararhodobacter zhoushanensis]|uniref:Nucleoside hydrolase n=1 Tax=Pararhodobacter zhoushanensis TaxID=2479545 RepID=A0ABT3GW07_9RHOB|nr:nucleoside hydrolase [Pararhodobacter zhoushanensis]MCW1931707.1 nucleoside hydrolase [Pararhodobacter zhoushanensis]
MKVIIDTDPGLDDAVAILFALGAPGFDVQAITSVAGNIGITRTTDNALRLLAVCGANVPVVRGAEGPLAGEGLSEEAIHGADGLGGVALPAPLAKAVPDAVSFMVAHLMNEPSGSVTILALAPLTNLALLARDHPAAFARLGGIIAMGGTVHEPGNAGPYAEFNLAADALAADIVLGAGVPLTLIPLDVTRQFRATPAHLADLRAAGTPAATTAAALIEAYFTGSTRESRPLHDPCVMLLALAPQIFGTDPMRLRVDTGDHPGRLVPDNARPAINVAMRIDAEAARETLWAGLCRPVSR